MNKKRSHLNKLSTGLGKVTPTGLMEAYNPKGIIKITKETARLKHMLSQENYLVKKPTWMGKNMGL